MPKLTIYRDDYADYTSVSNRFIDTYMKDANDAQLKVYLYLIRMLNANLPISVSGIADKFNHTEKDVLRALKYWEKQKLLDLIYDEDKNLAGIHMRDFSDSGTGRNALGQAEAVPEQRAIVPPRSAGSSIRPPAAPAAVGAGFVKPLYSADRLRQFKDDQAASQLLFIAESYIGRPLTPSEMKSILFFTDVLHFSDDLIDYLIQYCVDRGKKDFKYIEKVAVNWAEEGISTPKQAQKFSAKYDKIVYAIMNELGKSGSPTAKEMEYINRWTKEYGFSSDIIFEACQRTVLATDKHRFEYAEGILSSWKQSQVHHKADILKIDEQFRTKKSAPRQSANRFNQFSQNSYDFEALEKEILSN